MPVTAYWGDDQRLIANAVVIAACGVVIAWAALLFPAVAVDAPGATLRNAIADVHNSFWRALAIQALILLPFLIALIVSVTVIVTALVLTTENSDTAGKMAAKIIHPIWSFVMFSSELVWVAAAGRLFLALAERLQQPVPR